ncbi:hypothetical protein JP0183_14100 [Helicobacter pylori]
MSEFKEIDKSTIYFSQMQIMDNHIKNETIGYVFDYNGRSDFMIKAVVSKIKSDLKAVSSIIKKPEKKIDPMPMLQNFKLVKSEEEKDIYHFTLTDYERFKGTVFNFKTKHPRITAYLGLLVIFNRQNNQFVLYECFLESMKKKLPSEPVAKEILEKLGISEE